MTGIVTEPEVFDEARRKKAKKATAVGAFGTFIEYYDFSVYGYVAATLAVVFFPNDDPVIGLLNTFLVFGLAFLVRPLGAIFFGRLGDRRGRRTSLIASILLMSVAAALTGFLPGYAQIGIAAPILLVLLRMLQGFSTGGEIGGAASYIREWAAPDRRPFYISFVPGVAQLGKGAAAGIAALAAAFMPAQGMEDWGWRIPFLLAVPLGLLCLVMRLKVEDSPEFTAAKQHDETTKSPFKTLLADHRAPLGKVMAISTVQNVGTYIGTVFIATYLSTMLDFSKAQASTIVLLAVLCASVFIPISGILGSRIGAKKILLASYIAYAVLTVPSFLLMAQGSFGIAIGGADPRHGPLRAVPGRHLCLDHGVLPRPGPPQRCRIRPQRRCRPRRRSRPLRCDLADQQDRQQPDAGVPAGRVRPDRAGGGRTDGAPQPQRHPPVPLTRAGGRPTDGRHNPTPPTCTADLR